MHRGFTLIELLVVITIIGVLMALHRPGREQSANMAGRLLCLNNQKQIATAIIAYDNSRNHLPGVVNKTSGGFQYNWVEAILPNLDRADMWQQVEAGKLSGSGTNTTTARLDVVICPNDPYWVNPTSANAQRS